MAGWFSRMRRRRRSPRRWPFWRRGWPIGSRTRASKRDRDESLASLPAYLPDELFTTLLDSAGVRIERIVSPGHASPEGFWYDQSQHEWIVVLKGAAKLRFEDESIEMRTGDFVNIPAHKKHRVEWTTPDEPTIWLAVFYEERVHQSLGYRTRKSIYGEGGSSPSRRGDEKNL
ncbi:MAG TPA: cupin domain-containing protein [Gemmataceae bacterium]|nr:cupin domain-containing protein [Pirellulales bacterium]HZZ76994.1 cupin domain-containing protein [Gemmataceae bacterium]